MNILVATVSSGKETQFHNGTEQICNWCVLANTMYERCPKQNFPKTNQPKGFIYNYNYQIGFCVHI